MGCNAWDIVEFVVVASERATKTQVFDATAKNKTSFRKTFLIQDKKKVVDMFRDCATMNTKICQMLSDATGEGYWTWYTRIQNWIMADNKGKLNVELAVSVQRAQPKPVEPEPQFKQMTVDVAHRLVAFDCEIGCLQAQYENYKESAMKELDRQLEVIHTLTHEMNTLKAEYNVA